ncbi:alpha/beta hydrolase [Nocardia sp. NBC_00511]|uniref:alpha/beta hydrolase n=1 Tax=Nocardia sp. NBC_00511 TaxID=2903591 RepID=UPI0030DE4758
MLRPTEFPLEVCDLWPFPGAVHPVTPTRPPGAAPLLFVAQRQDPTTPVSNAERMARYTNTALLVLEGDGHTLVFSDVNRCVDGAVTHYLRDPDAAQSATCQ